MEKHTLNHEFLEALASSSPTPGGGGASAYVGALAAALSSMVANLTIGKKKYAAVEDDMIALREELEQLRHKLLELVDKDAEVFYPLSQAYGLPSSTDEEKAYKDAVMEEALYEACVVPLEIMRACAQVIDAAYECAHKGSRLVLSDAGVSAACARAALLGASLNVWINCAYMKNRSRANTLQEEAQKLIDGFESRAEEAFALVVKEIRS